MLLGLFTPFKSRNADQENELTQIQPSGRDTLLFSRSKDTKFHYDMVGASCPSRKRQIKSHFNCDIVLLFMFLLFTSAYRILYVDTEYAGLNYQCVLSAFGYQSSLVVVEVERYLCGHLIDSLHEHSEKSVSFL